ncbi:chromate transporter [Vaginisenegalia massiliensis]|uniref:chromate transporter n=1 Tax=Vaginisenegalia massiliensis TaxID=2058294 RepID=UPI000F5396EC|nr:chromate transporter [Vaginisenegalia massiliensis]
MDKQKLKTLFWSTFTLSAFTFGGGYVIISLMRSKFVNQLHWLEEEEMLDLIAIAQSSPGVIAVNGAIGVGYKVAGLMGVLVAVLGTVLPPFTIITVISFFYEALAQNPLFDQLLDGMQAGVAAVICLVVWDLLVKLNEKATWLEYVILSLAFIASFVYHLNVVYIILACIALGIGLTFWRKSTSDSEGEVAS